MGCIPLATDESRIRELEHKLRKFTAFALAHQEWEAHLLNDGGPEVDAIIDDSGAFAYVQRLRNEALGA